MKYLNYVPIDFFSENKTTVYSMKKFCLKEEGSAIGFDPLLFDLQICKIENGKIVIDNNKKQIRDDFITSNKYKEERREKYEEQGLFFDKFVEMLIENDTSGIENFRLKRSIIKLEIPKP